MRGMCIGGEPPCSAQGMIAPRYQFVDQSGTTTPNAHRFLWGLFSAIYALEQRVGLAQTQIAELQARLAQLEAAE